MDQSSTTATEKLDFDKDLCLYTLKTGFDEVALTLTEMPLVLVQIIIDYCAIFEPEDGGTPWPYFLDTTFNEEILNVLNNTGTRRTCLYTDYDRIAINILLLNKYRKLQSAKDRHKQHSVCWIFKEDHQVIGNMARFGLAFEKFKWMEKEQSTSTTPRIAADESVYARNFFDLVIIDGVHVRPSDMSEQTTDIVDRAGKLIMIVPLNHPKINSKVIGEILEIVRLDPKQGVTTEYLVPEAKSNKPDKSAK
jgi:hypothetical protein